MLNKTASCRGKNIKVFRCGLYAKYFLSFYIILDRIVAGTHSLKARFQFVKPYMSSKNARIIKMQEMKQKFLAFFYKCSTLNI